MIESSPIVRVPPPIPAPYLRGAPELRDDFCEAMNGLPSLPPELEANVTAHVYTLAAELLFRRERYQDQHGVEIVVGMGSDRRAANSYLD